MPAVKAMYVRLLVILLASCLQFHQLARDLRFHPDEALFMSFARNAAVHGDWILSGPLDKPPLSIYSSAVSMVGVGNTTDANGVLQLDAHQGEFAARLPNVLLAIVLSALMMRLSRDVYGDEIITRYVGLLMATSPYMLAFAATAFTDMSLLFWSALALWLSLRRRFGMAGLALGLAFWSKQQALWAAPLIVMFIHCHRQAGRPALRQWFFSLSGLLALLLLWDAARPETSIFLLGTMYNVPTSLIADPSTWLTRLAEWLRLASWLIAPPLLTLMMAAMAVAGWMKGGKTDRAIKAEPLLWLYILAYIALHTLVAFNQYDRYLLLVLPPLALLMACRLVRFIRIMPHSSRIAAAVGGLLVLSALWPLSSGLPIGGDQGEHEGIDELADYLNSKPVATVIYDPWLGWELGYYMGPWSDKRRVHYPTPAALVAGALALDEIGPRYLVAPVGQALDLWLEGLGAAGFSVFADYQSHRFAAYRLLPPAFANGSDSDFR